MEIQSGAVMDVKFSRMVARVVREILGFMKESSAGDLQAKMLITIFANIAYGGRSIARRRGKIWDSTNPQSEFRIKFNQLNSL